MGVCGDMGEFEVDQNTPATGHASATAAGGEAAPDWDGCVEKMAGYWIVTNHQVRNIEAFMAYTQEFDKVFVKTNRCKVLHHAKPKAFFEGGADQLVSIIEWPSVEVAISTKESSMYKAVCGADFESVCERDVRIVQLERGWFVVGRGYWLMNVQQITSPVMYDGYVEAFLANVLRPFGESENGYKGCAVLCGWRHILNAGAVPKCYESPRSASSQRKDTIIVQFDSIEDAIALQTDPCYMECLADAAGDATQFVDRDSRVIGCPEGADDDTTVLTPRGAHHGADLIDAFS